MMTEDEAKKKDCRISGHNTYGTFSRCCASDCGHWLWDDGWYRSYRGFRQCSPYDTINEPEKRPEDVPPTWEWKPWDGHSIASWEEPESEALSRRPGRCGLIHPAS